MGKVYDCFPFFNELEMLDLRFKLHGEFVDHFVIVESRKTFTGLEKPLYFLDAKERFRSHLHKVIHIVIDEFPQTDDPFEREYYQRHRLLDVASSAEEDDTFIIADADELLRKDAIERAKAFGGVTVFDMPMFQFYMNLQQAPSGWTACYAAKKKHLDQIEHIAKARWVRDGYLGTLAEIGELERFQDAGWHFTHLGGVDRLQAKFEAYSHSDDPWPRAMRNTEALRKHIAAGGIVGNFKETSTMIPISYPYYPLEINDNQSYYSEKGMIRNVYDALNELQGIHRDLRNAVAIQNREDSERSHLLSGLTATEFLRMAGLEVG